MNLGQSIRNSTKWLVTGSLGGRALGFLFGVALARLLVPEDFGLLVTVQIFTGVAGLIAGGGMGQALVRSKDASARDFNVVFTVQLGICLLIYSGFYIIAPYFAQWYHEPIYESLLRVSALSFLLRPLVGNHNAWLHREMRFKTRTIIGLITGLVTSISSVYMAWTGMGVWSLVLAGILSSIINWILLSRQTPLTPRLVFDLKIMRKISGVGVKFSLLDIVSYLRGQANNFIIGRLDGVGAVGLFNKAESLAKLPHSTINSAVYQPLFRALATEQGDIDKSRYLFLKTVTLLMTYTLPVYITISYLAEPFVNVVYGPNWTEVGKPLSILVWVWVFSCFGQPAGALLSAQNRLTQELVVQVNSLILNSGACILGIRWGLVGVAWGLLIARLYSFTHNYLLVRRCIPIRPRDVLNAAQPGCILGAYVFLALMLTKTVFHTLTENPSEPLYLATSLLVAGAAYFLAFIFFPPKSVQNEANRWKELIFRKK